MLGPGCDVVEVAAKEYADGARSLEVFGKRLKSKYGDAIKPDVMQAAFQKAAARYRNDYRQIDTWKTEMAKTIVAEARAGRSRYEKIADMALNIKSLPKTLMTPLDVSGTLRQGGLLAGAHPIIAGKAYVSQLRSIFGSRKYGMSGADFAASSLEQLKARPEAALYERGKMELTDALSEDLLKREEMSQSNLVDDVPVIGNAVKAGNRGMATHLNQLRADTFDYLARRADPEGGGFNLNDAQLQEIGTHINNASGRGALPDALKPHTAAISTGLFGAKLQAGRIRYLAGAGKLGVEMLAKKFKGENLTPIQKVLAVDYAKTMGAITGTLALAKLAGAEVETDARSSDFGKIKIGNARYDQTAGLAGYIVQGHRLATNEIKPTTGNDKGKIKPLGRKGESRFRAGVGAVGHFARGKIDPTLGVVVNAAVKEKSKDFNEGKEPWYNKQMGTDLIGRPTTAASEVTNILLPMTINGFFQSIAEGEGVPKTLLNTFLDLHGVGAGVYGGPESKKKVPNTDILDTIGVTEKGSMSRFKR